MKNCLFIYLNFINLFIFKTIANQAVDHIYSFKFSSKFFKFNDFLKIKNSFRIFLLKFSNNCKNIFNNF